MKQRLIAAVSAVAFLGLGACYDPEPEVEVEGGTEEAEAETEIPTTAPDTRMSFSTFDADDGGYLTREEWGAWWADEGVYGIYDMDAAEGLTEDEWIELTYTVWDRDRDAVVTETEWVEITDRWYPADAAVGSWADWDLDGDSELDANEVAEAYERENLYDLVDKDDDLIIDDEELADWFFDVFDMDDDQQIDVTEWDWGANYDFAT